MIKLLEKVIEIICDYQGIDKAGVSENSNLISDIGLSSFDVVSLACKFEEEFNIEIPDRKIRSLQTVGDIVKFIEEN